LRGSQFWGKNEAKIKIKQPNVVKRGVNIRMPLEGIRVIELGQMLAVPFLTRRMGDLGAEVIKVEPPDTGEITRNLAGPKIKDSCGYYIVLNRNKKGITLNLRHPLAREVIYKLAKVSDVVVENFRAKTVDKWGIGYDALKKVNPKIIYCSISGFGQEGPYSQRPAYDQTVQAQAGWMSITGIKGQEPCLVGVAVGDMIIASTALYSILAALRYRDRTGEGGYIDLSIADNLIDWLVYVGQFYLLAGSIPDPVGSGHPTNFHKAFKCKDDKWIEVNAVTVAMWDRLAKVLAKNPGYEGLPTDTRFDTLQKRIDNRPIMWPYLSEVFMTKNRDEWLKELVEGDVPCAPVNNIAEAFEDPQINFRKMVVEVDSPYWGKYRTTGMPIKMTQLKQERFEPPPRLGEHNEEILQGMLGYSKEEIENFKKEGVI